MTRPFTRRQALVALTLTGVFAPLAAHAAISGTPPPKLAITVLDVGGFDPLVRYDTNGRVSRHNLSLRTTDANTEKMISQLEAIQRITVAEFILSWLPSAGPRTLTMYDARLVDYDVVRLAQQGRGQNYDEFSIAMESTHGSLRLMEAQQTQIADYLVTEKGVQWKRYNA